MNDLSWFLYLADVIPPIGHARMFIGVGSVLFMFAVTGAASMDADLAEKYPNVSKKEAARADVAFSFLKRGHRWAFIIIIMLVGALIPSQKAMYLIMGSEISEEVINSETGKRVQKAINKKLDEYLGESGE